MNCSRPSLRGRLFVCLASRVGRICCPAFCQFRLRVQMELPARWFKAASRTEKGVFSVPRWSFGGSGTERGVFSVRDGRCRTDWHRIVAWSPRGGKARRCRVVLDGAAVPGGTVFCTGRFAGHARQTCQAVSGKSESISYWLRARRRRICPLEERNSRRSLTARSSFC